MADDIVRRMIDSEADANQHIGDRSFHHTLPQDLNTPNTTPRVTPLPSALESGGQTIHDELLRRAQQKAFLDSSLGNTSQFRDYKSSSVGSVGRDKDVRRELTIRSRQERLEREKRFGKHRRRPTGNRPSEKGNDRQSFNATGAVEEKGTGKIDRQRYNSENTDLSGPAIKFREPPTRGYNPFG